MLTKSANEQKCTVSINDISSSKDAHKQTNETTSRDEPIIKIPAPGKVTVTLKESGKASVAVDPASGKVTVQRTTGTPRVTNTTNEAPTPLTSKKKLQELR